MIYIEYVLELTAHKSSQQSLAQSNDPCLLITRQLAQSSTRMKLKTHLGSAQKEALSNSGTISVTFKYLAIATMSHICTAPN